MRLPRRLILAMVLGFIGLLAPSTGHAQTPVVGSYLAGWNMVGGPFGTDFSSAGILWQFDAGGYDHPILPKIASACEGLWANFPQPTNITLPDNTVGTEDCPLLTGWTLIGNPFSGTALLPLGVTGETWNPDRGAYDTVTAIPPGGATWIYSRSEPTITLTYQPFTGTVPTTVTIDNIIPQAPITVHVGDSIDLVLPITDHFQASADSNYLHLETAGTSGDLSCVGEPSCAISLLNQYWIYHAVNAGNTNITLTPQCQTSTPPCAQPSVALPVVILP